MQSILDRLVKKIQDAALDTKPDQNFYIEDVFDTETYSTILNKLPSDDNYAFINHPDAVLPNGTKTRKLLALSGTSIKNLNPANQLFWQEMNAVLISKQLQNALTQKFHQRMDDRFGESLPRMANVPIFYRDYPGYQIGIHTDAPWKVITMQFYFPKDDSQIHLGTSFHERNNNEFQLLKTNPFKPNSAYAFVRTENSWHSVKQLGQYETQRDSLALTIFLEDHEEYQKVMRINGSSDYI